MEGRIREPFRGGCVMEKKGRRRDDISERGCSNNAIRGLNRSQMFVYLLVFLWTKCTPCTLHVTLAGWAFERREFSAGVEEKPVENAVDNLLSPCNIARWSRLHTDSAIF
jgi:hypothetical protein